MSSRRPTGALRGVSHDTISRRRLLAVGGAVAVGSLAGCLDRAASSVTNTGASPAAVFAGVEWNDDETEVTFEMARGGPHVSRLTPTLSGGSGLVSGEVEVEGWVTSSAVMATDYNSSRSNKPRTRSSDDDSDGDGVDDADEEDELLAYLGGKPIVGERFTVCLPDAEVPGGNGSIASEVTPERLIEYVTGQSDGGGRVYSWGSPKAGPGDPDESGDCDDDDTGIYPGAVCGTSSHLVADITGPTATGGSLEIVRGGDGMVAVVSRPAADGDGPAKVCAAVADDDPCGPGVWARTTRSSSGTGVAVYQVLAQPPECPRPFPALLYVQQCRSDDQLVYTGGWVIDEAALYEDSVTVLSMAGATAVVGIECCFDYSADADGDGFGDLVERSVSGERGRRGARIDSGTVDELVGSGVLSSSVAGGIRKRPGKREYDIELKHVAVDAPVLHLTSASRASQDVKFKAGAELSKAVN